MLGMFDTNFQVAALKMDELWTLDFFLHFVCFFIFSIEKFEVS